MKVTQWEDMRHSPIITWRVTNTGAKDGGDVTIVLDETLLVTLHPDEQILLDPGQYLRIVAGSPDNLDFEAAID